MSTNHSEESSKNPFAITLLFYENYKRCRLNSDDLDKIAKKYSTKHDKLLIDLQKKYSAFEISHSIKLSILARLKATYKIPPSYLSLLPNVAESISYNECYDITNKFFDPDKVLKDHIIFAPENNFPPLDNISKAKFLVPTFYDAPKFNPPKPPSPKEKQVKAKHMFLTIAELSCVGKSS